MIIILFDLMNQNKHDSPTNRPYHEKSLSKQAVRAHLEFNPPNGFIYQPLTRTSGD